MLGEEVIPTNTTAAASPCPLHLCLGIASCTQTNLMRCRRKREEGEGFMTMSRSWCCTSCGSMAAGFSPPFPKLDADPCRGRGLGRPPACWVDMAATGKGFERDGERQGAPNLAGGRGRAERGDLWSELRAVDCRQDSPEPAVVGGGGEDLRGRRRARTREKQRGLAGWVRAGLGSPFLFLFS